MGRMIFSATDFLTSWQENPEDLGIVPSSYAAKILGKTLSNVDDLLKNGKLNACIIKDGNKKWKGITVQSLLDYKNSIKEINTDTILYKLSNFAKKKETVYYSDFMEEIGLNYRNPHHRKEIGIISGKASKKTFLDESKKFMISALIVNKTTNLANMPSKSFFLLAKELGAINDKDSYSIFFKKQIKLIFKYYAK